MNYIFNKGLGKIIQNVFNLDLRSLALFRICLALVNLIDLLTRFHNLIPHYTNDGVLPLPALKEVSNPFYWSLFSLSGQASFQLILFILSLIITVFFLIGYNTKISSILLWIFVISLQNRNPALLFAGDDFLRAILFWSMFLPLGVYYSIDSALNTTARPFPKSFLTGATVAFIIQLTYVYIWSALYKARSELWFPKGEAVYYTLSFDPYATHFGKFLLQFPEEFLSFLTVSALWFETFGPLLVLIPFYNTVFRWIAICSFIILNIVFGLCFEIGVFPYLAISCWLALLPTSFWDYLEEKLATTARKGLTIYYDAGCGFCKKVVHFLRTFLILSNVPLLEAQSDESIHNDMIEKNSWVVVDWKKNRHYKWEGLAYVFSLSPIFFYLAPLMHWNPFMKLGTAFYETIARNRKTAGYLTKPFKFKRQDILNSLTFNVLTLCLLVLVTIWNFKAYVDQIYLGRPTKENDWITMTHNFFSQSTMQKIDNLAKITRLDQSWSVFAPNPPKDNGWYLIIGILKDGRQVDLLKNSTISLEKPTIEERNRMYGDMQWRSFFINLNRSIGTKLYPYYANYLCSSWNKEHQGNEQIKHLNIYFMDETTVPLGEKQTVKQEMRWQQSCS